MAMSMSRPETCRASIADRAKIWADNKMKKIEMLKENLVDNEFGECTF
jgi:hypothetical protein